MGKRTYSANVAIVLMVAAFGRQCFAKSPGWSPPSLPLLETPSISPDKLEIDCAELAADPNIPAFLIKELCSPQLDDAAAQAEVVEEVENLAAEETAAQKAEAEEIAVEEAVAEEKIAEENGDDEEGVGKSGAEGKKTEEQETEEKEVPENANATQVKDEADQDPKLALVSFFRAVIQKLVDNDNKKVSPKDFWVQAYQEAGAPTFSRHPSFFELVAGLQQSVESYRSESSWWQVVRRLKDLTSDRQWKQLEASLAASHLRDPGVLRRTLGAAQALRSAIKLSLKEPQCRQEGVNPDPEDCREFYFCFRLGGRWKSKDAKCPRNMEFSPSRQRCVWAPLSDCQVDDSDSSSSDSDDDDSREILERVLRHGPAAFHHHHY